MGELPALRGRRTFTLRASGAISAANHSSAKIILLSFAGNCWANEVWSYGEEVCAIITEHIRLRERLRPYVMDQMKRAERTGLPPMRPLFVDYPDDSRAWEIEDQFLFGTDLLVAPVLTEGARSRSVYLPAGSGWRDAWAGGVFDGGSTVEADAPLERTPVYVREGSSLELRD